MFLGWTVTESNLKSQIKNSHCLNWRARAEIYDRVGRNERVHLRRHPERQK